MPAFMLIAAFASSLELAARALLYYLIPLRGDVDGSFAVRRSAERGARRARHLREHAGFGWERPLLWDSM